MIKRCLYLHKYLLKWVSLIRGRRYADHFVLHLRLPRGSVQFLSAFFQDTVGEMIKHNTSRQSNALKSIQTVHGPICKSMYCRYSNASHQAAITHHGAFAYVHVISHAVQRYPIVIGVFGDIRYLLGFKRIILKAEIQSNL